MTGIRLRTGAPRRAPVAPTAPPPDLRSLPAGHTVMGEFGAAVDAAPPRSRLARLVGLAPLRHPGAGLYDQVVAEREAGRLLRRLPADWTVLHSVPLEGAVVPHLLVGPAGVFALFPQPQAAASVWVSADLLAVDGAGSAVVAEAETAVAEVRGRLASVLRPNIPVVPVVSFREPARIVVRTPPGSARVLALEEVVPWLRSLAEVCSAVLVDRIADAAASPETWPGPAGLFERHEDRIARLEEDLATAHRRWSRSVRAVVAGSLTLLAGGAAGAGAMLAGLLHR